MANRKGQFKKGGGRIGSGRSRSRRRASHSTHRGRSVVRKTVVPMGVIAGMLPGVARSFSVFQLQGAQAAANEFISIYSGFDPITRRFSVANLGYGLMPLFAGLMLSRVVGGMLGVNRLLGRSRIPLLRI